MPWCEVVIGNQLIVSKCPIQFRRREFEGVFNNVIKEWRVYIIL